MTRQDVSLIPHVWRNPDRIAADPATGALFIEKKMADGGTIRLIVRPHRNELVLETAYKLKP